MGKIIKFPKKYKSPINHKEINNSRIEEIINKVKENRSKDKKCDDLVDFLRQKEDRIIEQENKIYNNWDKKPCRAIEHNPPMHLYIPPGSSHTHTCPGCGQKTTMHGSCITFCI